MNLVACQENLRRQAERQPKFPDGWHNVAVTEALLGRHEDALASLNRAIELNPQYLDALISRNFVLAELGRKDEGLREFRRLHVRSPDEFQVVFSLGVFFLKGGWKKDGLEQLVRAEEMRPNLPYVLLYCAAAHLECGNAEAAKVCIQQARRAVDASRIDRVLPVLPMDFKCLEPYRRWADPSTDGKYYVLLANLLAGTGDPEGAEALLMEGVVRYPGNLLLLCHLGRVLVARGKALDAERCLEAALRMDRSCYRAFFEISFLLAENGETAAAVAALRRATALRPLFPDYRYHLGLLLAGLGETDEAIDEFRRVLAISPGFGQAAIHLAGAHIEKREADAAIAALESGNCEGWPEAAVLWAQAYMLKGERLKARDYLEKVTGTEAVRVLTDESLSELKPA